MILSTGMDPYIVGRCSGTDGDRATEISNRLIINSQLKTLPGLSTQRRSTLTGRNANILNLKFQLKNAL